MSDDVGRRWEPCDGGFVSTYVPGPPGMEVVVTLAGIIVPRDLGHPLRLLDDNQARWLAARLAEAAGIHELMTRMRLTAMHPVLTTA